MALLKSFADVLQDGILLVAKKCHFGTYNPKANRAKMSLEQKFGEDKIILLELLPEFCTINMFNLPLPSQDEITSGLIEFIKTKKVTLWLALPLRSF